MTQPRIEPGTSCTKSGCVTSVLPSQLIVSIVVKLRLILFINNWKIKICKPTSNLKTLGRNWGQCQWHNIIKQMKKFNATNCHLHMNSNFGYVLGFKNFFNRKLIIFLKGGIFSEHFLSVSKSPIVKPLSALTLSPGSRRSSKPLSMTNLRSDTLPHHALETEDITPEGVIPIYLRVL